MRTLWIECGSSQAPALRDSKVCSHCRFYYFPFRNLLYRPSGVSHVVGDVAHIGAASEHSRTEILHIYIDSPFPGCERKILKDGQTATFPFSPMLGYPTTALQIADQKAGELVEQEPLGRGKRIRST